MSCRSFGATIHLRIECAGGGKGDLIPRQPGIDQLGDALGC